MNVYPLCVSQGIESATQLTPTERNGLVDNILSGQPIMHRQPVTVKQIIAMPRPMPQPVFHLTVFPCPSK
jgi:hypothetical protein